MFEEWEIGYHIQDHISEFGLRMSKKELLKRVDRMLSDDHDVTNINDIWLVVDGERYSFTKSRKENRWIVKMA